MSQPAFDFGEEPLDDEANPTLTVAELADAINGSLRRSFYDGVWVRGEIAGWNDRGNHAYFTLADPDPEPEPARGGRRGGPGQRAVIHVQFFANTRLRLRPMLRKHRLELADGLKVRIFGYLDFYAPGGRLGLKMSGIDPRYTLGEIAQSREEVLRRLSAAGLLDANARRPLPLAPQRIGVVTSMGTAAWHDFHDELSTSGFGFHLHVADTRVQGDGAIEQVATAVDMLGTHQLDAIVVIRGGGARTELAVFDAEPIAQAIASAPVPVLTGLGHEIDRSIADEVAHTALKTPTACAAALIERVNTVRQAINDRSAAIGRSSERALHTATTRLDAHAERVAERTRAAVDRADQRLAGRVTAIATRTPLVLDRADLHLDACAARLGRRPNELLEQQAARLDLLDARRAAVDPAVQLARGWTITRRADGRVVRSTDDTALGVELHTSTIDGTVHSTVTSTTPSAAPRRPDPKAAS
ncbi:MAG: exodeoxyribonuclease VII large subunit [Actinomycetota bacterium]